ncbi:hypothetical protein [Stenotrophomonas maltophilia]|uniref:hypothetical protein n=1 Tax=Stenotrophomonas maltophilia TaxID=40324 RepID=UPI0016394ED0|nr:hypothetical protein [Stenotrophomonas maltophilia]
MLLIVAGLHAVDWSLPVSLACIALSVLGIAWVVITDAPQRRRTTVRGRIRQRTDL